MNYLMRLRIGGRLASAFGLLVLVLVGVAVAGGYGIYAERQFLDNIVNDDMRKSQLLQSMSTSIHVIARVQRTVALLGDDPRSEQEFKKIVTARADFSKTLKIMESVEHTAEELVLLGRIEQLQQSAKANNDEFLRLARTDLKAAITHLLDVSGPSVNGLQDAIQKAVGHQIESAHRHKLIADRSFDEAIRNLAGLTICAVVMAIVLARAITLSVVHSIRNALLISNKVASGDLTVTIDNKGRDEIADLLRSMDGMTQGLLQIVHQVRSDSNSIASGAAQIAAGNMDLSVRTEQQAGALEETASSMEQLTATVRENAENSAQATALAKEATKLARLGGDAVANVVQTMNDINASSQKVVDIISVIDGIAFQTNILALNAAVEAARAGDQGRGFAVVASEVRTLAQRSGAAAKEIKALIGASVEQTSRGTTIAQETGVTIKEVVDSIEQVATLIDEIAQASTEQSAGISQIHGAVTELDQATQRNAALVEEVAATAKDFETRAISLSQSLSFFKTEMNNTRSATVESRSRTGASQSRTSPRELRIAPALALDGIAKL